MLRKIDYSKVQDINEVKNVLQEDGVLVLKNFCDMNLLKGLKNTISEVIDHLKKSHHFRPKDDKGNGFDEGWIEFCQEFDVIRRSFYDVIQDFPGLKKFSLQENYLQMAKELGVGIPVMRSSQIRMDLPNDERFLIPPHQEIREIRSPNMVFFTNPLVDINAKKGALKVAPGSHKLGALTPTVSDEVSTRYQYVDPALYSDYPLIPAEVEFGDTILLNMYTIHGSSQNYSKEIRWNVVTRFEDALNMPHLMGNRDWLTSNNLRG